LSRAVLQLVQLRLDGPARPAAQPRRHRASGRGDGEVHDVPAAHRSRQGARARRRTQGKGRRHADGLSADGPDQGYHVWRSEGRLGAGVQAIAVAAQLSRPRGSGDAPVGDLSQEGHARRGRPGGKGTQGVSLPETGTAQVTWADVNRDVYRTLNTAGNTYFAW